MPFLAYFADKETLFGVMLIIIVASGLPCLIVAKGQLKGVLLGIFVGAVVIAAAVRWGGDRDETNRQRAIVHDVQSLIGPCRTLGIQTRISVRGKVLVWDMTRNMPHSAGDDLESLRATSRTKQITVFMVVGEHDVDVGTYDKSGQVGYVRYIDVAVAYWPDKVAVGMASIPGGLPRASREVTNKPEYGADGDHLAVWIESQYNSR